jgi:hypothetical protein
MTRFVLQIMVAMALVGAGWAAARAQTAAPDFELIVRGPVGETTIECVRGCRLMWVARGINPRDSPQPTFSFGCNGAGLPGCSSGRVGGWIDR